MIHAKNYAPVLYIQSDCDTASDRDRYVLELMKYIRIDSYGTCINNARLEDRYTYTLFFTQFFYCESLNYRTKYIYLDSRITISIF